MANTHGKTSYFKFANVADTLTDYTAQVTNISWNPMKTISDSTAMGVVAKEGIDGQRDATFTVDGYIDGSTTALLRALYAARGTSKAFYIGPEGSTAGMQRITGTALLTGLNIKPNVDGVTPFSASFSNTGTWTEDTF